MARPSRRTTATVGLGLALALACAGNDPTEPDPTALRLPTGAALGPGGDWLFVVNSNLDLRDTAATLVALDLTRLDAALVAPAGVCRPAADGGPRECDAAALLDGARTQRLPSGSGNIAVDHPYGEGGPLRLLIPSARERLVTWLDVDPQEGGGFAFDCGQDGDGACDPRHLLRRQDGDGARLPADPGRLVVDDQGFRYAYLPHLTSASLTLIDLDGPVGPEITDIKGDLFRGDPYVQDPAYAGGFAAASRPCDPAAPPARSAACARPYVYASHRFWPGLKLVAVAPGVDVLVDLGDRVLAGVNPAIVEDRPYIGDLRFEGDDGASLLVVHTTPPALTRVDTTVDERGLTRDVVVATLPLCRNPNILALYDPPSGPGERLALVTCYGDDALAVVARGPFARVATVPVGDGPNEMVLDPARRRLYVIETLGASISVVDLDARAPTYLTVLARVVNLG